MKIQYVEELTERQRSRVDKIPEVVDPGFPILPPSNTTVSTLLDNAGAFYDEDRVVTASCHHYSRAQSRRWSNYSGGFPPSCRWDRYDTRRR